MKQKLYRHLDIDIETVALVDLHDTIWSLLEEGVHNNSSAFHTPALATIGDNGADVRTVVLRHADPAARQICCHTDWRSPKRRQIENHPRVSWSFYERERRIQLRLHGLMSLHRKNDLAQNRWTASSANSRRCYSSPLSPGNPVDTPMDAPKDTDDGWQNFTVLVCQIDAMDWLYLHASGHRRVVLRWRQETWTASWIAP